MFHLWINQVVGFYYQNVWRTTLPQVLFKHFASKNQLPGFFISGTLVENGLSFNYIGASESSCCSSLVTTFSVDMDLYFPKVMWSFNDDVISIIHVSQNLFGVCYQSCYQKLVNAVLPKRELQLVTKLSDLTMMTPSVAFELV